MGKLRLRGEVAHSELGQSQSWICCLRDLPGQELPASLPQGDSPTPEGQASSSPGGSTLHLTLSRKPKGLPGFAKAQHFTHRKKKTENLGHAGPPVPKTPPVLPGGQTVLQGAGRGCSQASAARPEQGQLHTPADTLHRKILFLTG